MVAYLDTDSEQTALNVADALDQLATALGCCAALRMSMKAALRMRTTDAVMVLMVPA